MNFVIIPNCRLYSPIRHVPLSKRPVHEEIDVLYVAHIKYTLSGMAATVQSCNQGLYYHPHLIVLQFIPLS